MHTDLCQSQPVVLPGHCAWTADQLPGSPGNAPLQMEREQYIVHIYERNLSTRVTTHIYIWFVL